MSRDLGSEVKVLTEDGHLEAVHKIQDELYSRHGSLKEIDLRVIIGAAVMEGFSLAGGKREIYRGSLLEFDEVDDFGVGTIFVRDATSHLEDDEMSEPTDDEVFPDDKLPDPWSQDARAEIQQRVDQGY